MDSVTNYRSAEINMTEFYDKHIKIVWVIRLKCFVADLNDYEFSYGIGFALTKGLIVTCHHLFYGLEHAQISVRRLDQQCVRRLDEQCCWLDAEIVYTKDAWDIVLLRSVLFPSDFAYGVLPRNGSLSPGQTVASIGNYNYLVGSELVSRILYKCLDDENVTINSDSNLRCENYNSTSAKKGVTPDYRVLGDFCNEYFFKDHRRAAFGKNLDPLIQVIQIHRFPHGVTSDFGTSSSVSSGSPVFNGKGEIVGMIVMNFGMFVCAIHCTVLREVLKLYRREWRKLKKSSKEFFSSME